MTCELIDTNVIIRFFVEDPETIDRKFKGVYSFFNKLESGSIKAYLPDLVLFQCYFVLTRHYRVPSKESAGKLGEIASFRGIIMHEKQVILQCLHILQHDSIDIVDAYILAFSKEKELRAVYSFDNDLRKRGLKLKKIG